MFGNNTVCLLQVMVLGAMLGIGENTNAKGLNMDRLIVSEDIK
jgi:hypothetical protein